MLWDEEKRERSRKRIQPTGVAVQHPEHPARAGGVPVAVKKSEDMRAAVSAEGRGGEEGLGGETGVGG